MKLFELRKLNKEEFASLGIEVEDVDFIIAESLNVQRTELSLIDEISKPDYEEIIKNLNLRKTGMPVSKIFKKAYFYGLTFNIDEKVLSPRQETELVVETALKYIGQKSLNKVLDLCTGSGCLAIAIKNNAKVEVTASDVSAHALKIAKDNAKLNKAKIEFVKSDMFENLNGQFDLIVSNPPYIASEDIDYLDNEVKLFDPRLALDGGELGLDYYNIIHDNARKFLSDNGVLILEIGNEQKDMIVSLFNDFNLEEAITDYSGWDRVLVFTK